MTKVIRLSGQQGHVSIYFRGHYVGTTSTMREALHCLKHLQHSLGSKPISDGIIHQFLKQIPLLTA
jgi:hypothetical protein